MRIAVMRWQPHDGIASMLIDGLHALDHETIPFQAEQTPPLDADIILVHGPLGSLSPLLYSLSNNPKNSFPRIILWQSEQMPNPGYPKWWRKSVGMARAWVDEQAYIAKLSAPRSVASSALAFFNRGLYRYRYYGDFYRLSRVQPQWILRLGSRVTVEQLREDGFDPVLIHGGHHPDYGEIRAVTRDIPVVWIGKIATRRRRRILDAVRKGLLEYGVEVLMIDGVENPYMFGEERTALLNRAKIMLNVVREPWDNNAMRFHFAAANGCLLVTEPNLAHTPFEPDVHIAMTSVKSLPELIVHYLNNEPERQRLAAAAHRLATEELTLQASLMKLLSVAAG